MSGTQLSWAPESCSLPTVERPLRERDFEALFRDGLRSTASVSPVRVELILCRESLAMAERLAAKESDCCSFFRFGLTDDGEHVLMTVEVPDRHADVLAALLASAERAAGLARS